MRPGWRDATDIGDDSLSWRIRLLDKDGWARVHTITFTATATAMANFGLDEMVERKMVEIEDGIRAEGGTLVIGTWPEDTKFEDLPDNIFGSDE